MRSGKSIAKAASSFTFGKDCYLMEQNQLALLKHRLPPERKTWLVTGGAGFIGSHLVEALLQLGQKVIILDNFSSGKPANIDDAVRNADEDTRRLLRIMEGDIADPAVCFRAMEGVDYVLHQAALASVPASLEDPVAFDRTNVGGTLRIFEAARQEGITRVVLLPVVPSTGTTAISRKSKNTSGSRSPPMPLPKRSPRRGRKPTRPAMAWIFLRFAISMSMDLVRTRTEPMQPSSRSG